MIRHPPSSPLFPSTTLSRSLAEAGEVPSSLAEPLQVIRQEAERAANIVKNLLSFARSQEGERKLQHIKPIDRKSTRLNSSHGYISYAVFFFEKKKKQVLLIY